MPNFEYTQEAPRTHIVTKHQDPNSICSQVIFRKPKSSRQPPDAGRRPPDAGRQTALRRQYPRGPMGRGGKKQKTSLYTKTQKTQNSNSIDFKIDTFAW